jgi:CRP/FNR family cyclic AMP-dependent transcriptional regulator
MGVKGVFHGYRSTKSVPAGGMIFREGDSGDEMYGVLEGTVELRTGENVLATLGPDDTFGEMAIVDDSPRSATAVAITDTTLAVIDHQQFLYLVQETPRFAFQVMSSMADRLRAYHGAPPS